MPGTNFRNGVLSRGVPLYNGDQIPQTFGNYYYVDSVNGSVDYPGTRSDRAVPTINAGYDLCSAGNDDVVLVMPGHVETASAANFVIADTAGVSVIGLGRGTRRPTITIDDTGATWPISAADNRVSNIWFKNDADGTTVWHAVTAAGVQLDNCFYEDLTTKTMVNWVTLTAAADYFNCIDCDNDGTDTAGNNAFLTGGAADRVVIKGLFSNGDFAAANIEMTAAFTNCLIENCSLENINGVDVNIEGFSAATGMVRHCSLQIPTDAQVSAINTEGAMGLFENYFVNQAGEGGKVEGTISA